MLYFFLNYIKPLFKVDFNLDQDETFRIEKLMAGQGSDFSDSAADF